MYFFFISVPNILGTYNSQNDLSFSIMLPVSKSDIVKAKITSLMILEMIHLLTGVLFAFLNTILYKSDNFMLDPNAAFFGIAFTMFGLFNLVMFPMYFKTAYNYGKPTIISSVVVLIYIFSIEILALINDTFKYYLEGGNTECLITQYSILAAGILIFILLSYISVRISCGRFEKINL